MNNKVSVCIIIKNEQALIEKCLMSVISIADEIIISDTGSTDNSKEIIKNIRDNLSKNPDSPAINFQEIEWRDDFSKARNETMKFARGDWILFIDADEILAESSLSNLKKLLENYGPNKIYNFKKINHLENNLSFITYHNNLFANNQGLYFQGIIHESVKNEQNNQVYLNCPSVELHHFPDKKNKTDKYIGMLKTAVNQSEEKDKYYYYYHLGNTYSLNNDDLKAINAYENSYQLYLNYFPQEKSFQAEIILKTVISLIFGLKNYSQAIKKLEKLLKISPDFPDALYYMAYANQYLGNYTLAAKIYQYVLNLTESSGKNLNPYHLSSYSDSLKILVYNELARVLIILGDNKNALFYLKKGEVCSNEATPLLINLLLYYQLNEEYNLAIEYYFKILGKIEQYHSKENIELFKKNNSLARIIIIITDFLLSTDNLLEAEIVKLNNLKNKFVK